MCAVELGSPRDGLREGAPRTHVARQRQADSIHLLLRSLPEGEPPRPDGPQGPRKTKGLWQRRPALRGGCLKPHGTRERPRGLFQTRQVPMRLGVKEPSPQGAGGWGGTGGGLCAAQASGRPGSRGPQGQGMWVGPTLPEPRVTSSTYAALEARAGRSLGPLPHKSSSQITRVLCTALPWRDGDVGGTEQRQPPPLGPPHGALPEQILGGRDPVACNTDPQGLHEPQMPFPVARQPCEEGKTHGRTLKDASYVTQHILTVPASA